jgi:tRNA 2-thiocytidine biosynthesis protein TtcA
MAFGHHADDVAQTTLLNLLHHGRLEMMEPRVSFFGGKIIVIRPLVYVPEKELVRFARSCGFPMDAPPCPRSLTSTRTKMKDLLRTIEKDCPQVKINLFRAVQEHERSCRG